MKHLVEGGILVKEGQARATRYWIADDANCPAGYGGKRSFISKAGTAIQKYVSQPLVKRKRVGYVRTFLDSHRPNEVFYLAEEERAHLFEIGRPQVAGPSDNAYAGQILGRLLIDLSWNSSRLEGNSYSLVETRRLIHFCQEAENKSPLNTQMILNHKDALEFLSTQANTIGFNRYTFLNLHAILADNLQADPGSAGRLRQIVAGIEESAYHPPGGIPQVIEECFDQILATAGAIKDPFEQAFFILVQLPYLQPFDDANLQISRLAANISLIKAGLSPLSFKDVPKNLYFQANRGVYELNRTDLLKDIFIWSYERTAAQYNAVQQSASEPDSLKLRHHGLLREVINAIVRETLGRKQAGEFISDWTADNHTIDDREAFRECIETELLNLHEGNFARYLIQPAEFQAWQKIWSSGTSI